MTILLTNTSQLSTSLNTLQFSQHTPYSCQLILISYYSSIKLLKSSTQSTSLLYSSQTPYNSQLNQITYIYKNKHFTSLNSFKYHTILRINFTATNSIKYPTILTINTLKLSTHSNTLQFS